MSLINQDIKNLVSGISQQPPVLRHPEQLEEQTNGFSSEAGGLQKRPPTLFVSKLHKNSKTVKPYIHFINRDSTEQYCVIFDGTDIIVYDVSGNKYSVTYSQDKSYIQTSNPRYDLKMCTIADYTFIVNRNITAKMSSALSTNYWSSQGLLVNIKSGQYGRTYKIVINGKTYASQETPDGSDKTHTAQIATDYIAAQLATQARNNGLTVTTGSSWLYLTGVTISSFAIYDGYNNQAAYGFTKTAQKFSNLPASAPNNFTVKVIGETGSDTDDYYVRYDTADGVWKECICPNIAYAYDLSTMPHVLIRQADGTFIFKRADWESRDIGDEDSNPLPSFVDEKINDVFYFRNRLGLLAGENVILTRSANFFNFWMQSATKVQDTDPIDLAASDATISTLYNAVPYDTELIVFSREAQFSLTAEGVMTPTNAVLTPAVTHYEASLKAKPVNAGRNIYFVAERALYSTAREFFIATDNTESKDVQDITSHVPNLIPNGVYKIVPSTVENIMMYLTEGNEYSMYVYKYLFIDGQRVQASWSEWQMQDRIYGAAFIDNWLYLVVLRNGYYCLERISFTFNTTDYIYEPYRVLLDSKRTYTVPSSAYNKMTDETSISFATIFGDLYDKNKTYGLVATDGAYVSGTDKVTLVGDYSGDTITTGINYMFRIVMSTIAVKQSQDGSTTTMTDGRLQLRQMWYNYADSGYFKVIVSILDKKDYIYEYTSRLLGTRYNILEDMPFTTGSFRFPIQAQNDHAIISLESDTPLPVALVGAGWTANYQRRTRLV